MKPTQEAYMLTVVGYCGKDMDRTRCWAWFPTFDMAEKSLRRDTEFYFELGYYNYCVIEKTTPGIGPYIWEQVWFKVDFDREKGYTIEQLPGPPEEFKQTVNWSIG